MMIFMTIDDVRERDHDRSERDLEFWILDALADIRLTLYLVLEPSVYSARLNRPRYAANQPEVIEALKELIRRELLTCCDCLGNPVELELAISTAKQVKNGNDTNSPYLELSRRGGDQWEQWAIPDWDRYVGYFLPPPELEEDDEGYWYCLGATNLPAIENEVLWLASVGAVVVNATQSLPPVKFAPWMATYWKELPEGFQQAVKVIDTTVAAGDAVLTHQPGWTRFGIHKHRP
jgi:hypothetical protein